MIVLVNDILKLSSCSSKVVLKRCNIPTWVTIGNRKGEWASVTAGRSDTAFWHRVGRFSTSQNFDLSISCDRPCLELQNASLSFDIDCFVMKL